MFERFKFDDDNKLMARSLILAFLIVFVTSCAPVVREGMDTHGHNPAGLLNKTWLWEATVTPVERIPVDHPEHYTIRFTDHGRLQAKFDCNSGGGTYTLSDGKLSFGPLKSTRMACPEGSLDAVFMRDLQRAGSFFLRDGMLFLELPFDSGTMRFSGMP